MLALVAALARNVRPGIDSWSGAAALGKYVLLVTRHLEEPDG